MATLLHGLAIGDDFDSVLAAARAGEEWALEALYRELHPGLLRYLRAQDRAAGEDLAAEVWLAAVPGLAGFQGDEAGLRGWLFTIARRRLIEHRRRLARRRTAPVPPAELEGHTAPDDPEAAAIGTDAASRAVAALTAALPAEQAEVVLLRVVGGLSVAEVAEVVGKRPGAVRVIQHRALRRLAERLPTWDEGVTR